MLGIAGGYARLIIGGPEGYELEVSAGDALLLPAGTGHRNIGSSEDFLVVGAYPPGQYADSCRDAPTKEQMANLGKLPFPDRDPLRGLDGALQKYWVSHDQE